MQIKCWVKALIYSSTLAKCPGPAGGPPVLFTNKSTYSFVIKDFFTTEEINDILKSEENRIEYEKRIIETQDSATKRAIEKCPDYGGREMDDFLSQFAGE